MPTERSPLLANEAGPSRISSPSTGWYLSSEASKIIKDLRSNGSLETIHFGEDIPPNARLAVLLFAVNELSRPLEPRGSLRRRIQNARRDLAVQEVLLESIEKLLDGEQEDLQEDGIASLEEVDMDETRELFWTAWEAGDGANVCAMQLLLPPHSKSSSPFLSHPLVRHALGQAWRIGVANDGDTGWLSSLSRAITPRRTYILHLASLLVWVALTLAIAISPGRWITPYDMQSARVLPNAVEVLWMIWTVDIARSLSFIPSLLALPIQLSLLTLPNPSTTYTLIARSIPLLTTILILPTFPSLTLLFPASGMMPISTLLLSTLSRSLRPLAILLPVMVITLALFSWAINGDPFRAFFIFYTMTISDLPEEAEDGVAPFTARLSLFVTLCLLLVVAITLGFARSTLPQHSSSSQGSTQGRRWKGDVLAEDDWEREYGVVIGRRARKRFGQAVLAGLGMDWKWAQPQDEFIRRIDVACPLDLLILPLDIVIGIVRGMRRLSHHPAGGPEDRLWRIRQFVTLVLMGPLCYLLGFLS